MGDGFWETRASGERLPPTPLACDSGLVSSLAGCKTRRPESAAPAPTRPPPCSWGRRRKRATSRAVRPMDWCDDSRESSEDADRGEDAASAYAVGTSVVVVAAQRGRGRAQVQAAARALRIRG